MGRLSENSVINIKNRSFSVTAEIDVPDGGCNGTIIAQGGRFGGWGLGVRDGRLVFGYNVLGIQEFTIVAETSIASGNHQVRMEFAYDGGGLGKGGNVTLFYDGSSVGSGRVDLTQGIIFSADETTEVGYEAGTPVMSGFSAVDSKFTGKIQWVQIDTGDDDHDHFIGPRRALPHSDGNAIAVEGPGCAGSCLVSMFGRSALVAATPTCQGEGRDIRLPGR